MAASSDTLAAVHQPGLQPKQLAVGVALSALALALAIGAAVFPVDKGYSILGTHVFPMAVAAFMGVIGVLLCWQAATGGFRQLAPTTERPQWIGAAWVTAGLLIDALLITRLGFVLSSALLFVLAAYGFGSRRVLRNLVIGVALALPIFWLFTAGLGLSLPSLFNAWI